MGMSKVGKKGLTTVPAMVRKVLGIEEGDILVWEVDKDRGIVLVRVVKDPFRYLKGKYSSDELRYEAVEESCDEFFEG